MQKDKLEIGRIILLSIFVISLSLFTYQVALTRIYSAILSYHYVFLTTSFAILGVGLGSILAYHDRARLNRILGADPVQPHKVVVQVNKWVFALACGFVCVFVLIYIQPFIDSLIIYSILGLIPFIISGYLFSMLFKLWPWVSGKMYFSDLLGAGAGSIAIVALLDNLGMFKTAVLICLLPFIIAAVLPAANKRLKVAQCAIPFILAVGLFLPMQVVNSIEVSFYAMLNNTGKTFGEMQRSGLAPEIVFSRWDSFARTDLIAIPNIPQLKILTIDGSANAPMYEFDGDADNLDHFKANTGFIPFAIAESNSALTIGAGGGRGVLYALAAGSSNIAAVEINPASIEAARIFGDFNGHLFDRPEVRTYIQDGRNFVRTIDEQFDVIFLSLVVTNTTQGVGLALSENYVHTVQAMEDYLDILSAGGRVAFVTHDQNSLIRLTTTAMQALVNRGVPLQNTPDHIALFYLLEDIGVEEQMIAPVIIIKNQPFVEYESLVLEREILNIGATPAHIPQLHEWANLSQVSDGLVSLHEFADFFYANVGPVTDNSPYFFHFDNSTPSVLLLILLLSLLGALLLLIPHLRRKGHLRPSVYFGLLGMGFMMVQIPLIQMFILYLGHPTLAFSYILAAMLIGCGLGGFLNSCKPFRSTLGKVYLPPVIAAVICFIVLASLQRIFQGTAGLGILGKVIISSVVVAVPGFFMGMPFPRGMVLLGESNRRDIIPVMWGINGTMSVAGSVISIILSMTFGFTVALIAGAVIYLAIGLFREI